MENRATISLSGAGAPAAGTESALGGFEERFRRLALLDFTLGLTLKRVHWLPAASAGERTAVVEYHLENVADAAGVDHGCSRGASAALRISASSHVWVWGELRKAGRRSCQTGQHSVGGLHRPRAEGNAGAVRGIAGRGQQRRSRPRLPSATLGVG
jgi:hypothetical protein